MRHGKSVAVSRKLTKIDIEISFSAYENGKIKVRVA